MNASAPKNAAPASPRSPITVGRPRAARRNPCGISRGTQTSSAASATVTPMTATAPRCCPP